tara:strand:+ start:108470 stop:109339 length:870 start_codon:yes stop_codon:yes gene_type:complete
MCLAADDNAETKPTTAEAIQADQNIMIRQMTLITGYQPLSVAGQEVDATFLEETLGEVHGAIVLLHDQGEDLESRGVITPLRHEMLQYGWSTLSLMLDYPFTPNILLAIDPEAVVTNTDDAASIKESVSTTDTAEDAIDETQKESSVALPPISNQQRIEAAVALLVAKGIKRIVFIGHGKGGEIAINALASLTTPISALMLVGTGDLESDDVFKTFNQPIFDVYGDQDLEGVSAAVKARKVVMKRSGNIRYTSREIIGANHVFYGLEPMLIASVRGWLHATFVKQEASE